VGDSGIGGKELKGEWRLVGGGEGLWGGGGDGERRGCPGERGCG